MRAEREVFYGGARGGGKTDWGIIKVGMPILEAWQKIQANGGKGDPPYPFYRALVIRRNIPDLDEWVDRADRIYRQFGGRRVGRPATFEFFGGRYKIVTAHLEDKNSYEKYQGQEFHKMLIEEATQIPEEDWYNKLIGSCRSTIDGLDAQILLTANPGNAGHAWVRRRFIHVYGKQNEKGQWIMAQDEKGHPENGAQIIPPGFPFFVPKMQDWRIFIPARVDDNPSIKPDYVAYLDSLPEQLRKAWRYGDWDSFVGQYFAEFRPQGPLSGEPENARHVIPAGSVTLQPWWTRWIGMDWGFSHPSAVYWACKDPSTGRIHLYRELVEKGIGSVELGAKIAVMSRNDLHLMIDPFLTLSLSPDAWGKRDETFTIAQNIARGIDQVLGLGTSRLIEMDGSMKDSQGEAAVIHESNLGRKSPHIVIRPATNSRVEGWQHMRELMRFRPLYGDGSQIVEVLPKLQIWDSCTRLIDCLGSLVCDETRPEDVQKVDGDDPGDGARYTLMASVTDSHHAPLSIFLSQRIQAVESRRPLDTTGAYMVALKAESDYKKLHGATKPVNIPRIARRGKFDRASWTSGGRIQ